MRRAPLVFAVLAIVATTVAANSVAQAAATAASNKITLTQAMADPDWIGPQVEGGWWRWDGKAAQFLLKHKGETYRDTWQVGLDGAPPVQLDNAARADIDAGNMVYADDGSRSAFVRSGDVFVRNLRSGALTQLTRDTTPATRLQWSHDGGLIWVQGPAWYRWDGCSVAVAAQLKTEDAPGTAPKADDLRDRQLRLIDTLRDDRARRDANREQMDAMR